ncbi:hypothetical protein [Micromonospora sp. NPDC049033]|uniref:hypothetical protein n=1 Tax=Micromonospora sp. NPDC049033 TaxID=3155149 RepID=UPI003409C106
MSEPTLLQQLLPVGTLLLGAGIASLGRRNESRRKAAELLVEIDRKVWTKGGDGDWLDLQVYLGQLEVALRSAGVPQRLVDDLSRAAVAHWRAAEHSGDPDVGLYILGDEVDRLRSSKGRALDWLDRPWKLYRRWRAFRSVPAVAEDATRAA